MLFFRFIFKFLYEIVQRREGRTLAYLLFFYGKKKRYQPCEIKFLRYRFHLPDAQSFVYQFKEIFFEEYYYFKTEKKVPIIIDCGSNIGLSILYFKEKYPQSHIKAFEADKNIADYLKRNLETNNAIQNVTIYQKAVWIDNNGIEMSLEGADTGSIIGTENRQKIDSIRLKDILEKENEVDMLKMDIEGAEIEVIKDCEEVLNKCKRIFIEYHDYQNSKQTLSEILAILEKNNFRYFIKNEQTRRLPFVDVHSKNQFNLQVNIFAIKN